MVNSSTALVALQPGVLGVAIVVLAVAALNDIATRTIPDLAPISVIVLGLVVHLADGKLTAALIVSAVVLVASGLCWRFGWLGGGDVKLLSASAWLVSPGLVPQLMLTIALAGGVLACLYLALRWVLRNSRVPVGSVHRRLLVRRIWRAERWRIRRGAALPYGCAIAVGTVITLTGG